MYIQLTTRCNMSCPHCCFDCGPKGIDMTEETFNRAISLARENYTAIMLGGGEPTLHPLISQFIMKSVWELSMVTEDRGAPAIHIITNGSNEDVSLHLAKLAQIGVISANLSLDEFHDRSMQSEDVIRAFKKPESHSFRDVRDTDYRGINTVHHIVHAGRSGEGECSCSDLFVSPDGSIYPCGCQQDKIGSVYDENLVINSGYNLGYCSVYNKEELAKELEVYQ